MRTTPTAFTWDLNPQNGTWENTNNWVGGAVGSYPGYNGTNATTNDTVSFPAGQNYATTIVITSFSEICTLFP
jgi:hypothetical protein